MKIYICFNIFLFISAYLVGCAPTESESEVTVVYSFSRKIGDGYNWG